MRMTRLGATLQAPGEEAWQVLADFMSASRPLRLTQRGYSYRIPKGREHHCVCNPSDSVCLITTHPTWEAGRDQNPAKFLPSLGHLVPHFARICSVVWSRRTRATNVPAF